MTHLSDFSYLQRDAQEIYLTIFLLLRMWQADGFKCLSPRRVISGELRSIVTWFMFLLMIAQASWDFLCTYIKYTEGFMQVAPGVIISKPFQYWSVKNQDPIEVMNYIQCVTFSLQVSILLLLQCFWNYLSNVVAKHSFMGSKEFTFYIIWTVGNIAMFPILQYFYKHTDFEEVVPQTAYSCEILIVALLGFRNHTRFKRLIKAAKGNDKRADVQVTERLAYFKDMNLLLSVALVAFGGSMFILCIDGFTTHKVINSNKFAADLLICNTNISSIFLWLIIIGIFHPARVAIEGKKKNKRTDHFTATQETPRTDDTYDIPLKAASATLSPIASPQRYAYASDNKSYYMDSSTKALNTQTDSEMGYMSSSPPASASVTTSISGGLYQQYHQRPNVVSIDDPYANGPISFSMMNNNNNTVPYDTAIDYYGINKPNTRFSPSPPLPPSPSSFAPSQQLHSLNPSLGLRSTVVSPPPTQELPPVPQQQQQQQQQQNHYQEDSSFGTTGNLPWLERPTSPNNR